MNSKAVENFRVSKVNASGMQEATDKVAVEEPLQIQLQYSTATGQMLKDIAVTMRTPGNDAELAAGFLFTEGIISRATDIVQIRHNENENLVKVILEENIQPVLNSISRNFYTTSSCGICGKASIEAIQTVSKFTAAGTEAVVAAAVISSLPDKLKQHQKAFEETGGIHASALFDTTGNFILLREDVGRHNALDKIIGTAFMQQELPLNNYILLLSGRASFELVQKAAMAGIRIIGSVGAPSSLAVEMATEHDITLLGFIKADRFNIYSGRKRISV